MSGQGRRAKAGTKRASGEGTVFRRRDGKWCARTARDPRSGKRREFSGDTEAEAIAKRDAFARQAVVNGGVSERDPTLAVYLRGWLKAAPAGERAHP